MFLKIRFIFMLWALLSLQVFGAAQGGWICCGGDLRTVEVPISSLAARHYSSESGATIDSVQVVVNEPRIRGDASPAEQDVAPVQIRRDVEPSPAPVLAPRVAWAPVNESMDEPSSHDSGSMEGLKAARQHLAYKRKVNTSSSYDFDIQRPGGPTPDSWECSILEPRHAYSATNGARLAGGTSVKTLSLPNTCMQIEQITKSSQASSE